MAARLAILITALLACGGSDKPVATPAPAAAGAPEPETIDEAPPRRTDTEVPKQPDVLPPPAGDHTGSIRGTVISAISGNPLAGVTVFLRGPDGMMSATTDHKGNYEIAGVPPGTHQVTFSYKNTEAIAEVEVAAASATVVPVALTLSKTAPVIVH